MGYGGGLVEITPKKEEDGEGRQQDREYDFCSFLHEEQRYNRILDG